MISDTLQNLIDWDAIMPLARYAGGHDSQMKALFKDANVIAHYNEGDWQGVVATAVQLADGRYCWYEDSYGSCSGCDAWEDASDESVRTLCINLANSARISNSYEELINDLSNSTKDSASWRANAAAELLNMLNNDSIFD
jgi:hypothetical protein